MLGVPILLIKYGDMIIMIPQSQLAMDSVLLSVLSPVIIVA
jgi:hypothetical protein